MPAIKTPHSPAISVSEAFARVMERARLVPTERRPLRECLGGVLRENVGADRDFPPFDRVTMDGIAFSYDAFERGMRRFRVTGLQAAGMPPSSLSDPDSCIEVMTGAVLPAGCNCVVPVEELTRDETSATLAPDAVVEPFRYVHRRGCDRSQGELLLREGAWLRSPEIAVCATVGQGSLAVSKLPTVAVVATGDELVDVGSTPASHQIRISNNYAVEAALRHSRCAKTELFHVRDDRTALEALLGELLSRFDLLVVSGGVSAGKLDLVPPVLEELGVRTIFHHVAQRPGYPLLFGAVERGPIVFALPGNPVSSLVSTHRYIIPFLEACCGASGSEPQRCVLAEDYRFEQPRTLFLPVKVHSENDGTLVGQAVELSGSGDLAGILASDGFLELPAEESHFPAGTSWSLTRWK